jgi:putative restriction endonuclease
LRRNTQHAIDPDVRLIGASVLVEPFFLQLDRWLAPPADWSSNLTRGKVYDTDVGEGRRVWEAALAANAATLPVAPTAVSDVPPPAYGGPVLVTPRLGQGAFRIMVTDAYERRCMVTGERTLPVLEAAHIKPYNLVQRHEVSNGILLRSDLHILFDRGYLTITPDTRRLLVSKRIHDEFDNGRYYYALHGQAVSTPANPAYRPSSELLDWHVSHVFRG